MYLLSYFFLMLIKNVEKVVKECIDVYLVEVIDIYDFEFCMCKIDCDVVLNCLYLIGVC